MAPKKPSVAIQKQMLAILEYASQRPKAWHRIGSDPIYRKAIEELRKQGVIEVWSIPRKVGEEASQETARYRIVNKG